MNARELRLGNLVYEGRDIVRVAPVHIQDQSVADLKGVSHLQPILLNEDYLFKFGFEKKGVDPVMFTNGLYNYFPDYKYFGHQRSSGGLISSKIEYVHQLQNLFYDLTDTELEFVDNRSL